VFAAPIVVPAPGEYVADGGAGLAARALTGRRPSWASAKAAEPAPDFQAVIRAQCLSWL
jgi:xylulokinase